MDDLDGILTSEKVAESVSDNINGMNLAGKETVHGSVRIQSALV